MIFEGFVSRLSDWIASVISMIFEGFVSRLSDWIMKVIAIFVRFVSRLSDWIVSVIAMIFEGFVSTLFFPATNASIIIIRKCRSYEILYFTTSHLVLQGNGTLANSA